MVLKKQNKTREAKTRESEQAGDGILTKEFVHRVFEELRETVRHTSTRPSFEEQDAKYSPILEALAVEVEADEEFRKANGYYRWGWRQRKKAAAKPHKNEESVKSTEGGPKKTQKNAQEGG